MDEFLILYKPPVFWAALIVFAAFSITGILATLNKMGKYSLSMQKHQKMAKISILLAIFHAALAVFTSEKIYSVLGGTVTLTAFISTSLFAYSTIKNGPIKVSVRTHQFMVYASLTIALSHAIIAIFFS
jgi:hypothetical protein